MSIAECKQAGVVVPRYSSLHRLFAEHPELCTLAVNLLLTGANRMHTSGLFHTTAFCNTLPQQIDSAFWSSIPEPFFWPMLVLATLAAVVASQAVITGTFSIVRQVRCLVAAPQHCAAAPDPWLLLCKQSSHNAHRDTCLIEGLCSYPTHG